MAEWQGVWRGEVCRDTDAGARSGRGWGDGGSMGEKWGEEGADEGVWRGRGVVGEGGGIIDGGA